MRKILLFLTAAILLFVLSGCAASRVLPASAESKLRNMMNGN